MHYLISLGLLLSAGTHGGTSSFTGRRTAGMGLECWTGDIRGRTVVESGHGSATLASIGRASHSTARRHGSQISGRKGGSMGDGSWEGRNGMLSAESLDKPQQLVILAMLGPKS
jgi:hypothetical protein